MEQAVETNEYFCTLTGCLVRIIEKIPGGLIRCEAIKVPKIQRSRDKRFVGDRHYTTDGHLRLPTEDDIATLKTKSK